MPTDKPPDLTHPPFQFRLKHLLLAITGLCASFATAAAFGIIGTYLFCVAAGVLLGLYMRNITVIVSTFVLAALVALAGFPLFQRLRESHNFLNPYPVCQPNLRRLVLAMHQYNDAYGTMPPAYLADANGNPMHSWRVMLLPFLGPNEQQLYAQYDFSEPWDGPNNRLLAARIPEILVCPEDRRRATCDTSYVVVTGKTTAFNGSRSMSIDQLAAMDGVSATVLVVECAASGINWMQPRDLQYDQMSFTLNDWSAKQSVRSGHAQGANVAMADAAAKRVTRRVDPHAWQGAFTAGGGESPLRF